MNHLEKLKQQLMVKPVVQERERIAVVIKGERRPRVRREKETIKKYYFLDTGILGLFLTDQATKLLENQIYIELRRRGEKPYFLKRKTEVDFYIPEKGELIQVSYSISDPDTLEREVKGLRAAMKELDIKNSLIITYDEEKEIEVQEGIIKVIPAWKWLLNC